MVNPDRNLVVVLVTFPSEEAAAKVARALVEARLVACVNLVPGVRSIYRWEGAVQEDTEVLGIIKTTADRRDDLVSALKGSHPHDTPEIVTLLPAHVEERYLAWAQESVHSGNDDEGEAQA